MNFTEFRDDQKGFIRNTFAVKLGNDFKTYIQILQYSAQDPVFGTNGQPAIPAQLQTMIAQAGDTGPLPTYMTRSKCRDTSIGGNDAFNCYYQFNENDDVGHPFFRTDPNNEYSGLGRVYSENIDDNQQIMWITFGVPYFNSVTNFYSGAVVPDLAKIMNGGVQGAAAQIGQFLGSTVTTFLMLPAIPLVYLAKALNNINNVSITKYYEFQPDMATYYRCVESILASLAVNIGLANDGYFLNGVLQTQAGANGQTGSQTSNLSPNQLAKAGNGSDTSGLPDVFAANGYDIYKINLKRILYQNAQANNGLLGTDATITAANAGQTIAQLQAGNPGNFVEQMLTSFSGTLHAAALFIGFRVEKTTDSSESLSNQTGESSVAQAINSRAESARDTKFGLMGGNIAGGILGSVLGAVGGLATGVASALGKGLGVDGLADTLMGDALIDIPDVWKNSTFSKSYNFTFELRSPYGDPVSIMQSIYIPLSLILAGSLPRAAGPASYTSPFICRAYCKGMFAIPLGMITDVHIKRGDAQYGWNHQILPTCVDVSFSIKDLSPSMYLAMMDSELTFSNVFGANSSFQEYLMTLSGVGLQERFLYLVNLRKRAQLLLQIFKDTKGNPNYWGTAIANSFVGRIIQQFTPSTGLPTN